MTVGIPPDYVAEVLDLLNTTWHSHRHRFTFGEAQRLTGKLGHLAEGANWVFHLLTHLYASIVYALSENKRLLSDTSPEFHNICLSLKTGSFPCSVKDQVKHINFAMKRAAHLVHHTRFQYNINKTMRQEIDFFREKLLPESNIAWETPIAHIIPWTPTFTSFGDSCLEGAGGYCISLGFWWHIPFPEAVIQRTLKHKKDNKDGLLILINVLEFVTVIINYCAALHFVTTTSATDDPYPVLLNVTNNASALSWTTGACKKSKVGRLLARFFCSLMVNSPLGINSKWISTDDNKIVDDISHIKRESVHEDSPPFFDQDTARANLAYMGDRIDQEVAMSRRDKEIETEAARQAHYIQWGLIMGILDPCGHQRGYQRIVAIYIGYLTSGVNFRNKDSLRLNTVKGNATGINSLFALRGMEAPIVLSDPNNMAGILINNLIKEEDIARQRSPLDSKMYAEML